MRTLMVTAMLALAAAPASAQTAERPRVVEPAAKPTARVDCRSPGVEHAARPDAGSTARLAALPPAYRLHTVNRRLAGCSVHPEARRVSDRTGRIGPPTR